MMSKTFIMVTHRGCWNITRMLVNRRDEVVVGVECDCGYRTVIFVEFDGMEPLRLRALVRRGGDDIRGMIYGKIKRIYHQYSELVEVQPCQECGDEECRLLYARNTCCKCIHEGRFCCNWEAVTNV